MKSCMECKYYNNDNERLYNRCNMHHGTRKANDSCEYYCDKEGNKDTGIDIKVMELEKRVEALERIILRIL